MTADEAGMAASGAACEHRQTGTFGGDGAVDARERLESMVDEAALLSGQQLISDIKRFLRDCGGEVAELNVKDAPVLTLGQTIWDCFDILG